MSDILDAASRPRKKPQPRPTDQPTARKRFDRDRTPTGYDPDIWVLVLYFDARATNSQVRLKAPRPVIYQLLETRLAQAKGLWIDNRSAAIPRIKEMIDHYFAEHVTLGQEEYAADDFTSPMMWGTMNGCVVEKVRNRTTVPGKPRVRRPLQPPRPKKDHRGSKAWREYNEMMLRRRDGLA